MRFTWIVGLFTLIFANFAHAADVGIDNVWLRETIPGSQNGAAYFTITNQHTETVRLVGATTAAAHVVEVHEHVMRDGMMRMQQVPALEIAPAATIQLKPGGYHLMLFGLKKPLVVGEQVDFTLNFDNGDTMLIRGDVRAIK
jgi:periplasmic copper chaperone A